MPLPALPKDLDGLKVSLTNPPLERIRYYLERSVNDCVPYLEQYRHDFETRFALWAGQSRDGRRWQANTGSAAKVRPWEGASDVRAFEADEIINERVELMMAAFWRSEFRATALRTINTEVAHKVSILLHWRTRNHLAAELARELEKAAQWRETYGISALGIWWRQERRFTQKEVTLEQLVNQALVAIENGDPRGAQALQQLTDPLMDEQTIQRMQEMSPVLDRRGAIKILKELREKGTAKVPNIMITKNQPCWEALRLFLDVFCDIETSSFEQSGWGARRCVVSGEQLVEKCESEGWDREWANELWSKTRGQCYSALNDFRSISLRQESGLGFTRGTNNSGIPVCREDQVEVWHHYYKGIERKSGAPAMFRLVWSPLLPGSFGHHDTFDYAHGELPFIDLPRERVESAMVDSRSVPEIATTGQNTIKKQRDSENDVSDITTLPPLLVPPWRGASEVKLGPASQQVERKAGELRWLPPPSTGISIAGQIEDRTKKSLASYFGRKHPEIHPGRIAIADEHLTGSWLRQVAQGMRMHLALEQQYLDYATAEKVVGDPSSVVQISREDIQGQFTVSLVFDPAHLDPERLEQKLKTFKDLVLSVDTQNTVLRDRLVRIAASWVDPDLASQVVATPQMAATREVDDEKNNLSMIAAGVEPQMVPEGQNYQLRLTTLLQSLQTNPFLMRRIQGNPDSMAFLEARIKHLEAMTVQYGENRQIGRVGARPGMEEVQQLSMGAGAGQAQGGGQAGGMGV